MPKGEFLDKLKEFGKIKKLSELLAYLLKNVKACCLSRNEAIRRAEGAEERGQSLAALQLLLPILDIYEAELREKNSLDFNDMIHRATTYIVDGVFQAKWKYILVDEFQDISESRANLIKSIRDQVPGSAIFCVGDDWQSIYRFSGSDLTFTTKFRTLFGEHSTTTLDKTFRFNNKIRDVASAFVSKNPSQVKKEISTHLEVETPSVSVMRTRGSTEMGEILRAMHHCIFRSKVATDSRGSLPPIPFEGCHRFR